MAFVEYLPAGMILQFWEGNITFLLKDNCFLEGNIPVSDITEQISEHSNKIVSFVKTYSKHVT